jgi:hypothetical protein
MYEFEEDFEEDYSPPIPKRRATISHDVSYYDHPTEELKRPPPRPRRMRFRTYVVTGMVITLSLWAFATYIVIPWITGISNHWSYGQSLIYETAKDVGHGGVSVFFSYESDTGDVIVVEVVGSKFRVYTGPKIESEAHAVVVIQLLDVTGDGKLDMILSIQGQGVKSSYLLVNTGDAFTWTNK